MPLIPLRPLLEATVKYGFGQGAFNVNAVAQAKAAIEVHEMFRSAAILQGADLANGFMGGRCDFMNATLEDKKVGAKNIADAVKKYGADSEIPIVLHLDHGRDFDSCVAAIEGGYTSVMIDGSSLPFKENIELTREVVKYAMPEGSAWRGNWECWPGWRIMCSPHPPPTPIPWTRWNFSKRRRWTPWLFPTALCTGLPRARM